MPRPSNPTTPEGVVITRAIQASGVTQAKIADSLDISPSFVSQFASGYRPVPWDKAETLAALLEVSPEEISADYRRLQAHFVAQTPKAGERSFVTSFLHTSQYGQLDPATLVEAVKLVRELFMVQEGLELKIEHLEKNCTHLAYAYSHLTKKKAQPQRVQADSAVVEFSKYVRSQGANSGERLGVDAGSHRKSSRRDASRARDGGPAAAEK